MAAWTVIGEAGKALDATVRTLPELNMTSALLVFRSLAADTFSFGMQIDSGVSALVPELGQAITLKRDGSTFFTGIVTDATPAATGSSESVQVVVSGPWWYAEQIPLTYPKVDGIGTTADRVTYASANAANLKGTLEAVIARAITLGVPMGLGTVSNFFGFPELVIQQSSCASAIAELVGYCPDAATWFDYSTSPPQLNITRRGVATTRTVAIGTDDVTRYSIKPRLELKVEAVSVPYATRATNGRLKWAAQSAGTPAAAKTHVFTVSGPELTDFVPPETYESVQIQTIPTNVPANFLNYLRATDPVLVKLDEEHGPQWFGGNAVGLYLGALIASNGEGLEYLGSKPTGGETPSALPTVGAQIILGDSPLVGTKHLILDDSNLPDWLMSDNGITVYDATLNVDIYVRLEWRTTTQPTQPPLPGVVAFDGFCWDRRQNYYNPYGSFYDRVSYYVYKADKKVKLVDTSYPTLQTIYRRPQYEFTTPPTGFASNMLSAQNWLPYEGSILLQGDEVGDVRYRGCKVNVTGSAVSALATAGALVASEELDLMTGQTTVNLGAPARINWGTALNRVRRSGSENIILVN